MGLRQELQDALKAAMREKDRRRISTLRLILAAIKDRDIARRTEGDERDDDTVIREILTKMIRQREESIRAYEEGGRVELADQEREEVEIIRSFLPPQMSEEEVRAAVDAVIAELGAAGLKDIGRCMAALKERYTGRMDFALASRLVKERLSAAAGS
ncbi:MAG: aspartyl-tRNA amidotransferase subunit B [Rhodothalassiaceae bacterium]|nr:MAG: aspartyl-tRNA amidotransferase subunit B [Rhodothalassiaceae bacterium]